MDNDLVKKITGKNPRDFEFAADCIINKSDVVAFGALVEKGDFLFDFVKSNVNKRLKNAINENNFKNLFNFLKIYSADYEDLIVSTLAKFADEDVTDYMLDILENGSEDEKTYAAKYFSKINDSLAVDLLRKYSRSDNDMLAANCAEALAKLGDEQSYVEVLNKLKTDDEFEKIKDVKFLIAYGRQDALGQLFEAMKTSTMPENIASEIPYLKSFMELLNSEYREETILALNCIINGLGEIVPLCQIFDFQLYEIFEILLNENNSKASTLLLNAKLKFEQLTENNEYLYDENKIIKEEVNDIHQMLQAFNRWDEKISNLELSSKSQFIYTSLEIIQELGLVDEVNNLKQILKTDNQTIILKTLEVLKNLGLINKVDKSEVIQKISDKNILSIVETLF